MSNLPKKYKQFRIINYYRDIELEVICVTTSNKKFSELSGISESHIKDYCYKGEPSVNECVENPDVIYAKIGMGGEGIYVFERDVMYTFVDYKSMIDKHRETYSDYRDYLTKTNQK